MKKIFLLLIILVNFAYSHSEDPSSRSFSIILKGRLGTPALPATEDWKGSRALRDLPDGTVKTE